MTPQTSPQTKAPFRREAAGDLGQLDLWSNARYVLGAIEHALAALPDDPGPEWQPTIDALRSCHERLDRQGVAGTVAFLDHLASDLDLCAAFHGRLLQLAASHFREHRLSVDAIQAGLHEELRRRWTHVRYLVQDLPDPKGS